MGINKLGISFEERNYDFLLGELSMTALSDRRVMSDLILLYKIVNSYIDSPELFQLINLRVPNRSTRNSALFALTPM